MCPLRYNHHSCHKRAITLTPAEVVRMAPVSQAANGIVTPVMGDFSNAVADIERLVGAVPRTVAAALNAPRPHDARA